MLEVNEAAFMKLMVLLGVAIGFIISYGLDEIKEYYRCKNCIFYKRLKEGKRK